MNALRVMRLVCCKDKGQALWHYASISNCFKFSQALIHDLRHIHQLQLQGQLLRLPRHRRVCKVGHTGALGDERPSLLKCPAPAGQQVYHSML